MPVRRGGARGGEARTLRETRGLRRAALAAVALLGSLAVPASGAGRVAAAGTSGYFVAVGPARLLDSRSTGVTVDGTSQGGGPKAAGSMTTLTVGGRGGVPADALAAVVNVTAVNEQAGGYLTVYPCGVARPNASTLNFVAGRTIANGATVQLGTSGAICIYTSATTNIILDVSGYHPAGSVYSPVGPARLLDTRSTGVTVDGTSQGGGPKAAGSMTTLTVGGRGGVPADALAAVVNVTAVNEQAGGYLTVYPCGVARPNASTLNFAAGQTIANGATVQLGTSGAICIYTSATTNVVLDVSGYHPAGSIYSPVGPARLLDSRSTGVTVDGKFKAIGPRPAGSTTPLSIGGRGGVPADALAGVVNITAVGAQASGYLTVYPCGVARPNASTLNFAAGQTIANGATVQLGTSGAICIYTSATTNIILDISGHLGVNSSPVASSPYLFGDAGWSAIAQLTATEQATYLDGLSAHGLNATMVNLIENNYSANPPKNTDGIGPFVGTMFQSSPDERYWKRVDDFVDMAAARGITVLAVPAYIGNADIEGVAVQLGAASSAQARSYGEFLGARYASRPNIIWVMGGDRTGVSAALFDRTNQIAQGIRAHASQLMTGHAGTGSTAYSVWGSYPWLDLNNSYTYSVDPVDAAAGALAETPNRPTFSIEAVYEQEQGLAPGDPQLRYQAWGAMLAGSIGHIFGNNPRWHFQAPNPLYPYAGTWERSLDDPIGNLDLGTIHMGIFASFVESFGATWAGMKPDTADTFMVGGEGTGWNRGAASFSTALGVVYLPSARTITLDTTELAGTGNVRIRRFDPTNGTWATVAASEAQSSSRSINDPGPNAKGDRDWVYVVDLV